MKPHTNHGGFISIPTSEVYSVQQSSDDIPLRSTKQADATSYSIPQPYQPSYGHYQPVSKLRHVPTHHFWNTPTGFGIITFIGDLLLTVLPCLFLILAFQAVTINELPISDHGETIEQAAKLGPTLFPIVFAAVVGRLMRTFALWRAERGATLGILEQLNGSQNLLAALERAIMLPGLGVLSIGVVVLWALSPIGGQSSLRVLFRDDAMKSEPTDLYYFNSTGDGLTGLFGSGSGMSAGITTLDSIFKASLLSLERVEDSDLWGNIKIPYLEHISKTEKEGPDSDGWYKFQHDTYDAPYSSLTGIVVSGLSGSVEFNFTLESSYFNLTCTDPQFFTANPQSSPDGDTDFDSFLEWLGDLYVHKNSSKLWTYTTSLATETSSFLIDSNYNLTTNPEGAFNILYASRGASVEEIAGYNCTMGTSHVESEIFCNAGTSNICHVRRMRSSRKVTWPSSTAKSPWRTSSYTYPANLLLWLNRATSSTSSGITSPIDWYISGSDTPFGYDRFEDSNYHNVSALQIAQRAGTLINTAYQISFQMGATVQPPSTNTTLLAESMNSSKSTDLGYWTLYTNGTKITHTDIFRANTAWVIVTVVVSSILLFCGIASMIFKYGCRSPDILGFVSSMTRDNPNFEHVPGGDRLDGLARARVLRHVRVQIADVRPWDAEGHITLKNLGSKKRGKEQLVE